MKYIKLDAIIGVPDGTNQLDVMNFLTDALVANNCEWCANMKCDKDVNAED